MRHLDERGRETQLTRYKLYGGMGRSFFLPPWPPLHDTPARHEHEPANPRPLWREWAITAALAVPVAVVGAVWFVGMAVYILFFEKRHSQWT